LNDTLDGYAKEYTHYLEERIKAVEDRLSFEMAQNNYTDAAEDNVKIMTAWCPKNAEAKLEKLLEKEGVVYLSEEATKEDQPPVLLKNNKFTQLFEPIGKLFSLPAYSELDLTVYFAPFFLLFFGFCLGDMGYGVVLLIATTLFKRKANADIKPYLTLGQLFGISTTVIGFISGTLFGLPMAELPQFAAIKNIFISQDNMFYVALGIGFVQIIFGMCVQVYKQVKFQGWVFALNRIGWIIALLAGLTYLAADKLEYEVLKTPMLVLVILGAVLIVLFGSPKEGALKSIGLGLADLYNITGVAGDLLSYIRLFALGVSSAILGLVINSIGLSFDNIILTPLFLIIGHAANIMLASLSAFVHPMRLTFVEFYKNVGFLGGGKPYIPFKKNYKPSNKNN
jgi:V/A-type H+-transporting ATPase subunit I